MLIKSKKMLFLMMVLGTSAPILFADADDDLAAAEVDAAGVDAGDDDAALMPDEGDVDADDVGADGGDDADLGD